MNSQQKQAEQVWLQYKSGIVRTLATYELDPQLREDLAQEIFCAISQSIARIMDAENTRAYVYRIAHNVAVDHVARQVRDKAVLREPEKLAQVQDQSREISEGESLADEANLDRQRLALMKAVQSLAAPYRQVILLLLEDLSSSEIAEVLQINAGAVRVRINRAKAELRSMLDHE